MNNMYIMTQGEFVESKRDEKDFYFHIMYCNNCRVGLYFHIVKGMKVENAPEVKCNRCGCIANPKEGGNS